VSSNRISLSSLLNKNGEVVHRFAPTASPSSLEKYIVKELNM